MNTKFMCLVTLLLLAHAAEAQQPKKVPRIGYLSAGPVTEPARRVAFRPGEGGQGDQVRMGECQMSSDTWIETARKI
jgi:hypothetical protein